MRYLSYAPVAIAALLWLSRFFLRDGGVGVVNGVVVFAITWWVVIFVMLPIGVRGQHEDGEIVAGSEPGAPSVANLKQKAWWTTIATSVVWIIFFAITESGLADQWIPRDGSWG
jgi:predicted secreted protein